MAGVSVRMTASELRTCDGRDGRLYVALAGKIYDVGGEKGRQFYGPGGPYEVFAGRDATRALATMSMEVKDDYDDLDDLTQMQLEALKRWQHTFDEKYPVVGQLVKN